MSLSGSSLCSLILHQLSLSPLCTHSCNCKRPDILCPTSPAMHSPRICMWSESPPTQQCYPLFGMSIVICFSTQYHQLIRTDFGSNLSEYNGSSHNSRYVLILEVASITLAVRGGGIHSGRVVCHPLPLYSGSM